MGIWETLTKQRGLGTAAFRWQEPVFYRIQLRGDFWPRVGMLLAAWAAAIGVLLVLFAINVSPPGMLLAVGLGAVFGFGPAMLVLFLSRDQVSGRITIDSDGIRRYRYYASLTLTGMWGEWSEWPFATIDRCVIVPRTALDRSFSVMLLSIDSEWEIVGIPSRIELQTLAKFLTSRGVAVSQGKSVPALFTSRLKLPIAAAISAVGVVMAGVGVGIYVAKVGGPFGVANKGRADVRRPADVVEQPQRDQIDFGAPPGLPAGIPPNANPLLPETPPNVSNAGAGSIMTELIGGTGGTPFSSASPHRQPVVGIRFSIGSWAGRERVGKLDPLFSRDGTGGPNVLMAREGYAVGAIEVDAAEFVDAVSIEFMRLTPSGDLDASDSYKSEWIGRPGGKPPRTLSGAGKKVIGLCGRGAAILDAVGLILDR